MASVSVSGSKNIGSNSQPIQSSDLDGYATEVVLPVVVEAPQPHGEELKHAERLLQLLPEHRPKRRHRNLEAVGAEVGFGLALCGCAIQPPGSEILPQRQPQRQPQLSDAAVAVEGGARRGRDDARWGRAEGGKGGDEEREE